ncbi:hypothetical protein, partial [Burkholderia pseudomallei]|uniref:hypothetical protein n=1 Tax=Burkholderia pseudomallei TaxID=28450 RepID=UPI001C4BBECC
KQEAIACRTQFAAMPDKHDARRIPLKNKASLFQTFSSRFTYYAACTNKAKRGLSHGHREQACAGREADSM